MTTVTEATTDQAGVKRAIQIAEREILDTESQISRADAKGLGIVSALALVAALLVVTIGNVRPPAAIAILVAMLAFILALATALRALHPRPKGSHNPGGFDATMSDLLGRGSNSMMELENLAQQLVGRRAALAAKMRVLHISFWVTYFALLALCAVVAFKLA